MSESREGLSRMVLCDTVIEHGALDIGYGWVRFNG
jgi:hypothetical protein